MYRLGIKAVTGVDVESFFFIAQEKEPPYISQIYNPNLDDLITWGEKAIKGAIEKYLKCQNKGIWETYSDKIIELRLEPAPEDIIGTYDKEQGIIYAPNWIDRELLKYEV